MPKIRGGAAGPARGQARGGARGLALLGPAFVAAIAYVDPGNVAANLTAGARYGDLLVWAILLANAMAVLVQYCSAKFGLVTGESLAEHLGRRLRTWPRRLYWFQAEFVVAATDVAEVIGGAIALHLLFGLPLWLGGLVVGIVALGVLSIQSNVGQRAFESVIIGMLAIIAIGFVCGLFVTGVGWPEMAAGIVPRFEGTDSVLLAVSMIGATVMPHAIYLHSALARDGALARGWNRDPGDVPGMRRMLRATKADVIIALVIAGAVNLAMLLLASASLRDVGSTDTIEGAHAVIAATLGPVIAAAFAIGLLASGLASSSVGAYAGQSVIAGLLRIRIPVLLRRAVTLIPAIVLLAVGVDPTRTLVISQVVLSFGIPFALIPLARATGSARIMGHWVNPVALRLLVWLAVVLVTALNLLLIVLAVGG